MDALRRGAAGCFTGSAFPLTPQAPVVAGAVVGGLAHRHGLRAAAGVALRTAERAGAPLSVVVFDLDGFKEVNDVAGHAEGDRPLRRICDRWRKGLRASDLIARIGGDEFVVVLPGLALADATALADRLSAHGEIGCSTGAAQRQEGDDVEDLLDRADREMYRCKRAHRAVVQSAGGRRPARRAPADPRDNVDHGIQTAW